MIDGCSANEIPSVNEGFQKADEKRHRNRMTVAYIVGCANKSDAKVSS